MPEAKERPPAMSAYTPRQADTWMREQAQREERAKDKWVQRYGYPAPDADVRDAPALPSISTRGRTSATGFHVDSLDVAAHTNTNTTTLKHHHHQPQPQPPPPQQQQHQHSARRRPSAVQPQPTTSTSNTYGNGNGNGNTALPPLAHNSRAVVQQSPLPIQGAAGGETKPQPPQPPPPPFAPTAGTARMLGTSFSRFTGFYSPSFATHAPVSGSDVSGGRKQHQQHQQHQRHEVVAHLDPELTAKLKELRDEERCYRKKKDWMKTYADESVKFSSVTRSGGGTVRASPKQ